MSPNLQLQRFEDGAEAIVPLEKNTQWIEQQLFLSMYCFEGKSYEQISQEMNISESTVFRLRRDALAALQNEGKVSV